MIHCFKQFCLIRDILRTYEIVQSLVRNLFQLVFDNIPHVFSTIDISQGLKSGGAVGILFFRLAL